MKSRRVIIASAVFLYAAILIRYNCFGVGGGDSAGYFLAARLLSERHLKVRVTPLDTMHLDTEWRHFFRPLGLNLAPEKRFFSPSYPLGYPIHLVPFGLIGGWRHAPFYVTPIMALLTLFVVYKLARELGLNEELSVASAALLAVSPEWAFQAIQPMSDVTAAFWCTLAILLALRQRPALCGAAFAIAVWVRPSDLLIALAIGFAMRWRVRPLFIAIASSMPFAIALMLTNHYLFGSPFKTGYGQIENMMSWAAAPVCGPHYLKWLTLTMTPVVFPAALFVVADRKVEISHRWMLFSLIAGFIAFYSVYSVCDAWWYLRFLLPAFPAMTIGAMLVMRDFVPQRKIQLALIAIAAAVGIGTLYYRPFRQLHGQEITSPHAIHWAEKQLPPNALLTTNQMSGAEFFYMNRLTVRIDEIDEPDNFQELRAYAGNAGLKWYALIYEWEIDLLNKKMPGRWTKVNGMRDVLLMRLDS